MLAVEVSIDHAGGCPKGVNMNTVNLVPDTITADQRLRDCRATLEPKLLEIIEEAKEKGYWPAEVAMAIADAADDIILALAAKVKH
jgi:uncharacterized protein YfcZ (UPF0381/DUF406 family)